MRWLLSLALVGLLLPFLQPAMIAQAAILTVDNRASCDNTTGSPAYCTIQAAVNAASAGDTITVRSGVYNEHVVITKSLRLRGDPGDTTNPAATTYYGPGADAPVLDGSGLGDTPTTSGFFVASSVTDVIIEGFEVRNYRGFRASGVTDWTGAPAFSNITVRDMFMHGLDWNCVLMGNEGQLAHGNMVITRNRCEDYSGYGIELSNTQNSSITENQVSVDTGLAGLLIGSQNPATQPTPYAITAGNVVVASNVVTSSTPDPATGIVAYAWRGHNQPVVSQNVTLQSNTITVSGVAIHAFQVGNGTIRNLTVADNTITITHPNTLALQRLEETRCADTSIQSIAPTCHPAYLAADNVGAVVLTDVQGDSSVSGNRITLAGSMGTGDYNAVAVGGGATGSVTITRNWLEGNRLGQQNAGIWLMDNLSSSAVLNIMGNHILRFGNGIFSNAAATLRITYNRIVGNLLYGIANTGGRLDAGSNWWGCNAGPGGAGCDNALNTQTTPVLVLEPSPATASIGRGGTVGIRARIVGSAGAVPDGTPVSFAESTPGNPLGSLVPLATTTTNGIAATTFQAGNRSGRASIQISVDNQVVTTTIVITPAPREEPPTVYMPIVSKMPGSTPGEIRADLVVRSIRLTPDKRNFTAGEPVTMTIDIVNQGQTQSGFFWVDLHINPLITPTVNRTWDTNCGLSPCYGIGWFVQRQVQPGEQITLTSIATSYAQPQTIWPGWFARGTTDIYVLVDSWNPGVPTGSVDEETGETNNLFHLSGLNVTGENPGFNRTVLGVPPREIQR